MLMANENNNKIGFTIELAEDSVVIEYEDFPLSETCYVFNRSFRIVDRNQIDDAHDFLWTH